MIFLDFCRSCFCRGLPTSQLFWNHSCSCKGQENGPESWKLSRENKSTLNPQIMCIYIKYNSIQIVTVLNVFWYNWHSYFQLKSKLWNCSNCEPFKKENESCCQIILKLTNKCEKVFFHSEAAATRLSGEQTSVFWPIIQNITQ